MIDNEAGEKFLHQKDTKLHTSQPVEHEQERRKFLGEKNTQKPFEKIADWMELVKKTHTSHRDNQEIQKRINNSYHRQLVIKPEEIPEKYYETQKRLAREQGHGDIKITPEMREQLETVIISDQKSTFDNWFDYLTSKDADVYPTWAKYWVFKSMTRLSAFDKEKGEFGNRDKNTVAPFPDLNREALAYVVNLVVKSIAKENITNLESNPELQKLLKGANFGKLYAYAIEKVTSTEKKELLNTAGEWVKYQKGSDHMPLVQSLQGHATGWCTAGESTAQVQLKNGDFYVYYSLDKNGKATIPRTSIRMEENKIAEVRGIAKNQNLDPSIGEVVDKKLDQFPDGKLYKKKTEDMKKLTEIEKRTKINDPLSTEDLRFLYEIDSKIEGFGYQKDPRIEEIIHKRNMKADLSLVTGYTEDEICLTQHEALKGNIKYYYGNLNLSSLQSTEGLVLPQTVNGNLNLSSLQSTEGLTLPQTLTGDLYLNRLQSAEGLVLPQTVNGALGLNGLRSTEGLTLPQTLTGDLYLSSLQSAEGLVLPQTVNGDLYLSSLQSAEGLTLPQTVTGYLDLSSLQSTEGLVLPQTVNGYLDLRSLQSTEGLTLPQTVNGNLDLGSLQSVEGLTLPQTVTGNLDLGSLQSVEGLTLPQTLNGYLDLHSLQSTEGLVLPQRTYGHRIRLFLGRLQDGEVRKTKEKYPYIDLRYVEQT